MTSPESQPRTELITGLPTAEELKVIENERSLTEDTLSVGSLKKVLENRAMGMHAADLNAQNPVVRTAEISQPVYPDAQPTGAEEIPEIEQTITPERMAEIRKEAGL